MIIISVTYKHCCLPKISPLFFIEAYLSRAPAHVLGGAEGRRTLLPLYLVSKALYEVNYELDNRPAWVGIPLRGLLVILDDAGAAT